MSNSEFSHYSGCNFKDTSNCSGCALTNINQDSPNYAAWPLVYMENGRTIPAKWREAFKLEMKNENKPYADNVAKTMKKYGVMFSDGKGL